MKNDKIVDAYNTIKANDDAKKRILAGLKQTEEVNIKRRMFNKKVAAALTTAAAVLLFTVFGINLLNHTDDIFSPNNLFTLRAYAMEMQHDGTIELREIELTQLEGWTGHQDGEVLYISIGLWFEFEGYNIKTVEFSLEEGFFASQYIGNFGESGDLQQVYIGSDGRLAMYGTEFNKIGSTVTFGNVMDEDIILFWGNYDINIDEWHLKPIEIELTVTFDDGEIHEQALIIEFTTPGITTVEESLLPPNRDETTWLKRPTIEQYEYFLNAPLEDFILIQESVKVITPTTHYEFYVGDHTPITISIPMFPQYWDAARIINDPYGPFDENGISRLPMGIRDDEGFLVVIKLTDDGVFTAMVYIVPL